MPTMSEDIVLHVKKHAMWLEDYPMSLQYRVECDGVDHVFDFNFVDLQDFKVVCCTPPEVLADYPRGNALKSLLRGHVFDSVQAFAVGCSNALGDNVESVNLAGCVFQNGHCVTEAVLRTNEMLAKIQK